MNEKEKVGERLIVLPPPLFIPRYARRPANWQVFCMERLKG